MTEPIKSPEAQTESAKADSVKRVVRPLRLTVTHNQMDEIERLKQPASAQDYERILGAGAAAKIVSATMHGREIEVVV